MEPREYGELGIRSAMARLEDAVSRDVEAEVLVALSETLHWAYALNDHHYSRNHEGYEAAKDADPDGITVLRGLLYARDRATHSLAEAGQLIKSPPPLVRQVRPAGMGGARITAPASRRDMRWKEYKSLRRRGERRGRAGAAEYEQAVAGKDLLDPMRAGIRFLLDLPQP